MFIGSSTEGQNYADAVFAELDSTVEATPWDRSFPPTSSTFEGLLQNVANVDFAVFVFTPDDFRIKRGSGGTVPRDNVVSELFLFVGALGRERVFFLLSPEFDPLSLPTDLRGVAALQISERSDGNHRLMVRSACSDIRRHIVDAGIRRTDVRRPVDPHPPLASSGRFADLTSVEIRGSSRNTVLPEEFLQHTQRELLITALTARNTLTLLGGELRKLLQRGVSVGVLVLHPKSRDITWLAEHELINLTESLTESIKMLREQFQRNYPDQFAYRYMLNAPTFTAVMRDGGAFFGNGHVPDRSGGEIRVQPRGSQASQHEGVILTFSHRPGLSASGFTYFADDVKHQWDRALQPWHDN